MNKFLCFLVLLPTLAFASPGDDGCIGNCPTTGGSTPVVVTTTNTNQNVVNVKPVIDANARARAEAYAASLSKATSSSGGNVQSVTSEGTTNTTTVTGGSLTNTTLYPEKQRIYNVPSVAAPVVYPTSPCMGSSSLGGAGVGFGFSVGSSWTDDECGIRETSRSFSGLGLKDDAVSVLCTSKYASAAPVCNTNKKE